MWVSVGGGRNQGEMDDLQPQATTADEHLLHRVDYDDSQSLRLKYQYARGAGARGTGMWTASTLNYSGDPARHGKAGLDRSRAGPSLRRSVRQRACRHPGRARFTAASLQHVPCDSVGL